MKPANGKYVKLELSVFCTIMNIQHSKFRVANYYPISAQLAAIDNLFCVRILIYINLIILNFHLAIYI